MKLRIENHGRLVLEIDFDDLTEVERQIVSRIGRRVVLKALSAECNADFVAYWSVDSVAGLYRRKGGHDESR